MLDFTALLESVLLPAVEFIPPATLPDRNGPDMAPMFVQGEHWMEDERVAGLVNLYEKGEVRHYGNFTLQHPALGAVVDQLVRYAFHQLARRIRTGEEKAGSEFFTLCHRCFDIDELHPMAKAVAQAGRFGEMAIMEASGSLAPWDRRLRLAALNQFMAALTSAQAHPVLPTLQALLRVDDLEHGPTAWDALFAQHLDLDKRSSSSEWPDIPKDPPPSLEFTSIWSWLFRNNWPMSSGLTQILASALALSAFRRLPAFLPPASRADWGQPRLTDPALIRLRADERWGLGLTHVHAFAAYLCGAPALGIFPPLSVIDRMDHLQALDAASAGLSEADRPPLFAPIRDCIARDVLGETEARWDALVAEALLDPPLGEPAPDVAALLRPEHRLGPEPLQRAMARALAAAKISRALDREEED